MSTKDLINDQYHPGDRHDNIWLTIDGYVPPKTQVEWEQVCFLDKAFHGYNSWPKTIKYSINKRERYSENNMTDQATILYNQFMDKNFVKRLTQLLILDDEKNEKKFNTTNCAMFKVSQINSIDYLRGEILSRVFFETLVSHFLIILWNNYVYSFMKL